MGLTVGASCGIYHHGPEMLSFMGFDGGAEIAAGAGTGELTGVAADKWGSAEVTDILSDAQAKSL